MVVSREGNAINHSNRYDTVTWLQETIDLLERYKREVESGEVVITSGDAAVTSPAPEIDRATTRCVDITFDYVIINSQK